jgi:methylthioribose-1-phosphate isomerase
MRTIFWNNEKQQLEMIDQRRLPGMLALYTCTTCEDVIVAINAMVIRGAPAIGVCAAFGLALAAQQSKSYEINGLLTDLEKSRLALYSTRPTAVNLAWALNRMKVEINNYQGTFEKMKSFILGKAQELADLDVILNKQMARFGADLIKDGDTIIHHCNTGALATVDWGTALGVIRFAHEQGKNIHVLVDETRPRLQGSRLTAWELDQYGISYEIICDNMAGYFLKTGKVNKVLFGADRVAANGDVANKIGTYMLALAAHENNIPVYSVFPTSTIDITLENGELITIEERSQDEVLEIYINGDKATPEGAQARNPAFDVTPNKYISAMVTEKGVIYPPYDLNLSKLFENQPH